MSDPPAPRTPFIWQSCELPPSSDDNCRPVYAELVPPTGYMLHSWRIAPIGVMVICWVRMRSDLASALAQVMVDKTNAKAGQ